jgi:hypothetical protein
VFFEIFSGWVGLVSSIVGLITAGWAGYTAWRFRQEKHKIGERLQAFSLQKSGNPVAIAVGLGPVVGNIEAVVGKYLSAREMNMPIIPITESGRITEEKGYEILDRLLEVRQILDEKGITQVHLFYAGPVFLAPALGAALSNWVPTFFYQFVDGTYRPMMRLSKFQATVRRDPKESLMPLPEEK